MLLNDLKANPGSRKKKKRVGRGDGSGKGTYSGRGMKGQKARGSGKVGIGFEGGRTPLVQRMPKLKGFKNPNRVEFFALNIEKLNKFDDGASISLDDLYQKNLVKKNTLVKILGNGKLEKKKLNITAHKFSESAKKKIKASEGEIVEIMAQSSEK